MASSEDGGLKIPNLGLFAKSFNYKIRIALSNKESEVGIEWLSK
tara:strand:+ start:1399 stop:1530 length:132 start_codon:yes stop_codon:yes gene_type:complete